jgi:hypothetical protein
MRKNKAKREALARARTISRSKADRYVIAYPDDDWAWSHIYARVLFQETAKELSRWRRS